MKSYSPKLSFLEIIAGAIIGFAIVGSLTKDKVDFENLALGEYTSDYFATSDGYPIHLSRLKQPFIDNIIEGWKIRGKRDVLLVLGNSQTHAINQMKDSEITYNEMLFNNYEKDSIDVIAQSFPNANLQEFLLGFEYWKSKVPIKQLLVPLFMDDLREDGIREYFFAYLKETNFHLESNTAIAQSINDHIEAFKQVEDDQGDNNDFGALYLTVQHESEKYLHNYLIQFQ